MELILDAEALTTPQECHDFLIRELKFPAWYISNLDGMYQVLSGWETPLTIELLHWNRLGLWGQAALRTLREASRDNSRVTILYNPVLNND